MDKDTEVLVVYNRVNLLHKSSRKHPECPERLECLIDILEPLSLKLKNKLKIKQVKEDTNSVTCEEVTNIIIQVHGDSYWEFVKEMWHEGIKKPEMYINMDTYFMKDTYFAAIEAARTTVIAVNEILNTEIPSCFALVRPPGHHSGMKNQPHGFSFFNNLAIGVVNAINSKKAKKIAIVDWDAHHGEGTQRIFYDRNDVLFISLHRYDNGKFFPHIHQSSSENVGSGAGEGFNVNICWNLPEKGKGQTFSRQESCGDEQYAYAFQTIVTPVVREYNPDLIFISCGFDSAKGDEIGQLFLTEAGYTYMVQQLMKFNKKMFLILEGGYNCQALTWAATAVIQALADQVSEETKQRVQKLKSSCLEPNKIGSAGVESCKKVIEKYWNLGP